MIGRMELYSDNKRYKLYHWNMLDMWEVIESWTIDSIVTDPPYELNFMWKWWDNSGIAFQPDTWKKCYEALKPWWYLLAFGGSRTFHRIAVAIEDAGFEIRDTIMWLYGSWFPKSLNIWLAIDKKNWVKWESFIDNNFLKRNPHKLQYEESINNWFKDWLDASVRYVATNERAWWGTALKPSYEPIIVARKPLEWSCTDNVIKYGVGGINIDECRVWTETISIHNAPAGTFAGGEYNRGSDTESYRDSVGRFPSNTIIDEEVASWMPIGSKTWHRSQISIQNCIESRKLKKGNSQCDVWGNINHITEYTDSWSVARYFYCAKASKRDRDEWCDTLEDWLLRRMRPDKDDDNPTWLNKEWRFAPVVRKNTHPTVKPTDLMQYLVRLVTPNGWTVLDPFNWSWSTWKAVMYENKDRKKNYKYIWIELTDEYLPIAQARIEYVINKVEEKPDLPYEQPLF